LNDLEVVVRLDLEAMSELEKELEVIDLHLEHGGLTEMAKVRCLARAHEIKDQVPPERWRHYQHGSLEEAVANYLNLSRRSAARYISLVDLPLPIRQAFDAGTLCISLAERVNHLTWDAKQAIAHAITAGADPRDEIARHLPTRRQRLKPIGHRIRQFVDQLEQAQTDLGDWKGKDVYLTPAQQKILRQVTSTATQLVERCRTLDGASQQARREALQKDLGAQQDRQPPLFTGGDAGVVPSSFPDNSASQDDA
jgi:hypothetical protein